MAQAISASVPAAPVWYVGTLRAIARTAAAVADRLERSRREADRARWQAEERLEEMRHRIYTRYY
jgi:hypothetical protein